MATDQTYRKYYLIGGAVSIVAISAAIIYWQRQQNQDVIDRILTAGEGKNDPILTSGGEHFGDSRDLANSKIFSPSYWRTSPARVTIWAKNANGTDGPALTYAKEIWESKSTSDLSRLQIRDYPQNVVGVFKKLKTKEDVSKLADVFEGKYKTPLFSFINDSFMTNGCDETQDKCYLGTSTNWLKQVYDWIKNQLT